MLMNNDETRNANERTENCVETTIMPPELESDGRDTREIELIRITRDMKTHVPIVYVNGKRIKYGEDFTVDVCRDSCLVTYDMRGVKV